MMSLSGIASMGPAVANHLWQSTVFAAAVWVGTLLLRKNPARVRYSLWLAASMKFLVPFSLLIGLGGMLPRPQRVVTVEPAVYSAVDAVGLPFSDLNMPAPSLQEHRAGLREKLVVVLPGFVAGVWLCGVAVVLLVWCVRWRRVHAVLRRAVRAESGREMEILRRMGGEVELRLSRDLMEPGIFGVFRPVLLWPERLSERLDDEHIAAIMAHEMEHVRRRDNLTAMLHMVVEAAFWFHPMVWWMERRMVEERERACDEAVVQMGSNAEAYAESLLKACRFCVESPMVCVSGITGADLKMRIHGIMRLRLERLGFGRKALLAVAGIVAVAGPVLFGVMHAPMVQAQMEDAKGATFDVVSIKPHPAGGVISMVGMEVTPDEVHGVYMTVPMMVGIAYGVQSEEMVSGAPGWAKNERYDFTAKISEADIAAMKTLNKTEQNARRNQMLRAMLAERFHLTAHRATKQVPVYDLVAAKEGTKIQEGTAETNPHPIKGPDGKPVTLGMIRFYQKEDKSVVQAYSMKAFADFLMQPTQGLGRPVVDKTGMTGTYNFELNWVPTGSATATNDSVAPEAGASLVTALKEVGLRLQPSTGLVETVVIDHVERPAGDAGREAPIATAQMGQPVPINKEATPVAPESKEVQTNMPDSAKVLHAAGPMPSYEVATIKRPEASGISAAYVAGVASSGGSFVQPRGSAAVLVPAIRRYIQAAYGIPNGSAETRVVGGPAWIDKDAYMIQAKVPDEIRDAMQKMTPAEQANETRMMQQMLLQERFKLKVHFETREMPIYELRAAKGGLKIKEVPPPPPVVPGAPLPRVGPGRPVPPGMSTSRVGNGHMEMTAMATTMPRFINMMATQADVAGRPIVDKTGFTGNFDVVGMAWASSLGPGLPDAEGASLFTALEETLGMKLVPGKAQVEVVVIDSIERPSEN